MFKRAQTKSHKTTASNRTSRKPPRRLPTRSVVISSRLKSTQLFIPPASTTIAGNACSLKITSISPQQRPSSLSHPPLFALSRRNISRKLHGYTPEERKAGLRADQIIHQIQTLQQWAARDARPESEIFKKPLKGPDAITERDFVPDPMIDEYERPSTAMPLLTPDALQRANSTLLSMQHFDVVLMRKIHPIVQQLFYRYLVTFGLIKFPTNEEALFAPHFDIVDALIDAKFLYKVAMDFPIDVKMDWDHYDVSQSGEKTLKAAQMEQDPSYIPPGYRFAKETSPPVEHARDGKNHTPQATHATTTATTPGSTNYTTHDQLHGLDLRESKMSHLLSKLPPGAQLLAVPPDDISEADLKKQQLYSYYAKNDSNSSSTTQSRKPRSNPNATPKSKLAELIFGDTDFVDVSPVNIKDSRQKPSSSSTTYNNDATHSSTTAASHHKDSLQFNPEDDLPPHGEPSPPQHKSTAFRFENLTIEPSPIPEWCIASPEELYPFMVLLGLIPDHNRGQFYVDRETKTQHRLIPGPRIKSPPIPLQPKGTSSIPPPIDHPNSSYKYIKNLIKLEQDDIIRENARIRQEEDQRYEYLAEQVKKRPFLQYYLDDFKKTSEQKNPAGIRPHFNAAFYSLTDLISLCFFSSGAMDITKFLASSKQYHFFIENVHILPQQELIEFHKNNPDYDYLQRPPLKVVNSVHPTNYIGYFHNDPEFQSFHRLYHANKHNFPMLTDLFRENTYGTSVIADYKLVQPHHRAEIDKLTTFNVQPLEGKIVFDKPNHFGMFFYPTDFAHRVPVVEENGEYFRLGPDGEKIKVSGLDLGELTLQENRGSDPGSPQRSTSKKKGRNKLKPDFNPDEEEVEITYEYNERFVKQNPTMRRLVKHTQPFSAEDDAGDQLFYPEPIPLQENPSPQQNQTGKPDNGKNLNTPDNNRKQFYNDDQFGSNHDADSVRFEETGAHTLEVANEKDSNSDQTDYNDSSADTPSYTSYAQPQIDSDQDNIDHQIIHPNKAPQTSPVAATATKSAPRAQRTRLREREGENIKVAENELQLDDFMLDEDEVEAALHASVVNPDAEPEYNVSHVPEYNSLELLSHPTEWRPMKDPFMFTNALQSLLSKAHEEQEAKYRQMRKSLYDDRLNVPVQPAPGQEVNFRVKDWNDLDTVEKELSKGYEKVQLTERHLDVIGNAMIDKFIQDEIPNEVCTAIPYLLSTSYAKRLHDFRFLSSMRNDVDQLDEQHPIEFDPTKETKKETSIQHTHYLFPSLALHASPRSLALQRDMTRKLKKDRSAAIERFESIKQSFEKRNSKMLQDEEKSLSKLPQHERKKFQAQIERGRLEERQQQELQLKQEHRKRYQQFEDESSDVFA